MPLLLALLLSLTACQHLSTESKEQSELLLRVGNSQLQNGQYPQALTTLLKAEKIDPNNPAIQNNLGLAYFVREHYVESEAHFRKSLRLLNNYTDAKNNLGRLLIDTGRYSEAITLYQEALKDLTYGNPEKLLMNMGYAYFKKQDYKTAREYFLKSINIDRQNCFALNYYGRTLYELNNFSQAAEALDKAIGYCQIGQFDEPHYYSGLAYFHAGEISKAESRLEQVIKIYSQGKYRERAKVMLDTIRK